MAAAPASAAVWRSRRSGRRFATGLAESAFIWPMLVFIGTFVLAPTVIAIFRSFYDWNPGYESAFIGFDNYVEVLTASTFHEIGRNELVFILGVPLWAGVPLLIAFLLYERVPAPGLFRTIFFFPAVLSPVVVGILFRAVLRPDGLLNETLRGIGLGGLAHNWIDDPALVKPVVILVITWYTLGFGVLIYSAALASVPSEHFEAAELDGATWFQRLRYVMLPAILPMVLLNTIFCFATAFLLFPYIFVLTQGGPGFSSTSIDFDIYQNALSYGYFGLAAAESILLLLVMLFVLYAAIQVGKRRWS